MLDKAKKICYNKRVIRKKHFKKKRGMYYGKHTERSKGN